jgi:hypothetical protein
MVELFTLIADSVGVSASLLLSVCTVESGLRQVNNFGDANNRGSFGICQVSLDVAREQLHFLDKLALQQNVVNIRVSANHLKKLLKKYQNVNDAVSAYNMGHVRIRNNRYANQRYVDKISLLYNNNQ